MMCFVNQGQTDARDCYFSVPSFRQSKILYITHIYFPGGYISARLNLVSCDQDRYHLTSSLPLEIFHIFNQSSKEARRRVKKSHLLYPKKNSYSSLLIIVDLFYVHFSVQIVFIIIDEWVLDQSDRRMNKIANKD